MVVAPSAESEENTRLSDILFNRKKLDVIGFLLENSDEQLTISEINDNVQASRPFVSEFIKDMKDLGIVEKKRKGNLYLVQINNESPYISPLSEILEIDSQPLKNVAEELAEDLLDDPALSDYIYSIYLFGSVARGNPRKNSDVDILVVTQGDDENGKKQNMINGEIWSRGEKMQLDFAPTFYEKYELERDLAKGIAFTNKIKEEGILLAGEDLF